MENKYLKIFLLFWIIVGIPYFSYRGQKINLESTVRFYESDVIGIISNIDDGSGGYDIIELNNGMKFRFCSLEFDKHVKLGDSIYKPAFKDTIKVYSENGEFNFTFLKPDDIGLFF